MKSSVGKFKGLLVICGFLCLGAFWHSTAKAADCTYYMSMGSSDDSANNYADCMNGSPSPGNTGGTGGTGTGGTGGTGGTTSGGNRSVSSSNYCTSQRASRFQDAKNANSSPSSGNTVIVYYAGGGWDKFEYSAPLGQPNSPDWFVSDTGCVGSIASRN